MKDIGDRMKRNYELPSRHWLARRTPVVVRVDGRAFHTYTRGMGKPFDVRLVDTMVHATQALVGEMQGCKVAYVQSDEASFLMTDFDTLQTQPWFGYVQNKVETLSASIFTATFNDFVNGGRLATFDARAFNIPRDEVSNYFLWRALDWERNSVSMYCRSFYSHKAMKGQGKADQHEMLCRAGANWVTDIHCQLKNGTWVFPTGETLFHVKATYGEIAALLDPFINCDLVSEETDESTGN